MGFAGGPAMLTGSGKKVQDLLNSREPTPIFGVVAA
jgi:hypothetical protein